MSAGQGRADDRQWEGIGERVLFLDDEPAFLDGLRRSLRRSRPAWSATFSTDVGEIRSRLTSASDAVLVCDWHMPGIDGPSLCEELREAERAAERPRTYVILLTGDPSSELVVEGLERGADDFLRKPVDFAELAARVRVGLRMVALERRMREIQAELSELARTDALTGLLTRRAGEQALSEEAIRVERGLQCLSVLMVDVDHFKQINDTRGHATGDVVLAAVAARLRATCRPYDTVARWGGEEFLVLCPASSVAHTATVAERLLVSVRAPIELGSGESLEVTVSVGGVGVPPSSLPEGASWLESADQALYEAKASGRDCVRTREIGAPEPAALARARSARRE